MTEEEIYKSIAELRAVQCYFDENDIDLPSRYISDDVDLLPFEPVTFSNPISLMISEGLIMSASIDRVIRALKVYAKNNSDILSIGIDKNGNNIIVININAKPKLTDTIIRAMNLYGWFLARPKNNEITWGKNVKLQFEPKYNTDVGNEIRTTEKYLLHLTLSKNIEKIKLNGLVPSVKNRKFAYPERIYFLRGSTPYPTIYNLASQLAAVYNQEKEEKVLDYSIVRILLSEVPENVRFCSDPNFSKYGIYTMDNIPPSALIDIKPFKITV